MKRVKNLREQFIDARSNYNRILGRVDNALITEQPSGGMTGPFHVYKNMGGTQMVNGVAQSSCQQFGSERIMFYAGYGSNWSSYCNASNNWCLNPASSAQAHQEFGSPNPGQTAGIHHQNNSGSWMGGCLSNIGCTKCWEYVGTIQCTPGMTSNGVQMNCTTANGTEYLTMAWQYGTRTPYGAFPNCNDCNVASPLNNTPSFDCDPNTLTCSDPGTGNGQYPTMADCTTNCSCDTTTASPCAVQWWQNPNATWASNWITNRDCSNYTWPSIQLETQALALMASAPNPQPGPYNNWNDIWGSANAGWPNTTGGPKAQFIGKMAKAKYSQCQKQACNC